MNINMDLTPELVAMAGVMRKLGDALVAASPADRQPLLEFQAATLAWVDAARTFAMIDGEGELIEPAPHPGVVVIGSVPETGQDGLQADVEQPAETAPEPVQPPLDYDVAAAADAVFQDVGQPPKRKADFQEWTRRYHARVAQERRKIDRMGLRPTQAGGKAGKLYQLLEGRTGVRVDRDAVNAVVANLEGPEAGP